MRVSALAAVLGAVLGANLMVVAVRSAAPAGPAARERAAAPDAPPSPSPAPKPKPKPKPPMRVVFSATAGQAKPRVYSVTASAQGLRRERRPAEPLHAIARGKVVASETLDYNEYTGCGIAGCTTTRAFEAGIVVKTTAGRGRRVLTKGGYDTEPSFSPDGSLIAYLSHASRKDGTETDVIDVMTTAGRVLQTYIAPRGGWYAAPMFSPDGRFVAAVERRNDVRLKPRIVLLRVGSTARRAIGEGKFDQLAWAPNGAFVVARGAVTGPHPGYSERATTGYDLWVVPVNGKGPRRLTRLAPAVRRDSVYYCGRSLGEVGVMWPVVSPDSRLVAYATNAAHRGRNAASWDVQAIRADGTGQRTLWRAAAPRCLASTQVSGEVARPLGWV